MKAIVINGSPKGEKSGTMRLTNAFVEGLKKIGNIEVEVLDLSKLTIEHCLGCLGCWYATPGNCVINDQMKECLAKYIDADIAIWSFPLYSYGMPSKIKAFLDRMLPLNCPQMAKSEGRSFHPARIKSFPNTVVISSCGFYNVDHNYEGLITQLDLAFRSGYESILCGEGGMINAKEAEIVVLPYLEIMKKAGCEYAKAKAISKETKKRLQQLFISADEYIRIVNGE